MRKKRKVAALGCVVYFSVVTRAIAQGCPTKCGAATPPPPPSSGPVGAPPPYVPPGSTTGFDAAAAAAATSAATNAAINTGMSPGALPTDVTQIQMANPVANYGGGSIDAGMMDGSTPSMNAIEYFGGGAAAVGAASQKATQSDTKATAQALYDKYVEIGKQVFDMRKQKETLEKEIEEIKNSKYKDFETKMSMLNTEGELKTQAINKLIEKANEKWEAAWDKRQDELYAEYKREFYANEGKPAAQEAAYARYNAKWDREYGQYQEKLNKEGAELRAEAAKIREQLVNESNKYWEKISAETDAKVAEKQLVLNTLKEKYDALVTKQDTAEKEFKVAAAAHNETCSSSGGTGDTKTAGGGGSSGGGSGGGGSEGLTTRELVEGYENLASTGVADTGQAGMTAKEYDDKSTAYHNEHATLTEERTRILLEVKNSDRNDPKKLDRLKFLDDRISTIETRWNDTQNRWNKQQEYLAQVARDAKAKADADAAAAAAKKAQEQASQTTQTVTTTPIDPYQENKSPQEYNSSTAYTKENEIKALQEYYHFRQRTQKYLEDALTSGSLEQSVINDVLATAGGFRNSDTYAKLPPDVQAEVDKFESFWNNAGKALPQGLQAVSGLEGQVKTEAQRNKEFMDNISSTIKTKEDNINITIPDVSGKYNSDELGRVWIITRPVPDESVKTRNQDITGTFTPPGEEHQVNIVGKFDSKNNSLEFTYQGRDGQTKIVKLTVNADGSLTGNQNGSDGKSSSVTAKRPDKYEIPIGSRGGGYNRDTDAAHIHDLSDKPVK